MKTLTSRPTEKADALPTINVSVSAFSPEHINAMLMRAALLDTAGVKAFLHTQEEEAFQARVTQHLVDALDRDVILDRSTVERDLRAKEQA